LDKTSNTLDNESSDIINSLTLKRIEMRTFLVNAYNKSSEVVVGLGHDWVREEGGLTGDIVPHRRHLSMKLLFEGVAGFAVEEDLEIVAMIEDGNSVVLALKFAPEWDLLLMEPLASRRTSVEDDLVFAVIKADAQHHVVDISMKVEAGVVEDRALVKLRRAEDDDSIGFDVVRKRDSFVNGNEVEGSHTNSNNLEETIGGK